MLRKAIQTLAENYDTPLEELLEYKNIVEENLENPELYTILGEQFRPTILKIGTAGAYLWGCDQNYYGNVSKSCSPLCSGGISYRIDENYQNEENKCQYQIWTYDKELKNKENILSNMAYIYVNNNWNGFKKSDIETLKNNNVEFVSVLKTDNSKHYTEIPMSSLVSIPVLEEVFTQEEKTEKSYKWFLIFLIMIILTIVIVLKYEDIVEIIQKTYQS